MAPRSRNGNSRSRPGAAGHVVSDFVPRYYQVYALIQQRLREGEWSADKAMPTEQEFAEAFGVSRVTIRKALNMLEGEKLILRQQGRGTFASPAPRRSGRATFSGMVENIVDFELNTSVRVLQFENVALSESLATMLAQPAGAPALKVVRVRSDAQSPFSYTTCYIPEPEARLLTEESLGNRTIIATLENAGVSAATAEQRLSATAAGIDVAKFLKLEVGAPLISMTRVVRNDEDRPVELMQALYRPDKYEYRVNLSRGQDATAPRWTVTT
jgi:GntR family transcriptional regulator